MGDKVDLRRSLVHRMVEQIVKFGTPVPICNRLIQPNPRLSVITTVSWMPIITAVASSEFAIMYEPSPSMQITSRSGSAILMPMAPAIS